MFRPNQPVICVSLLFRGITFNCCQYKFPAPFCVPLSQTECISLFWLLGWGVWQHCLCCVRWPRYANTEILTQDWSQQYQARFNNTFELKSSTGFNKIPLESEKGSLDQTNQKYIIKMIACCIFKWLRKNVKLDLWWSLKGLGAKPELDKMQPSGRKPGTGRRKQRHPGRWNV